MSGVAYQHVEQPDHFEFSAENQERIKKIIAKYPEGRQASAIMPMLDLAQRQHGGWIPRPAMQEIAKIADVAEIRVYEVATFYTMFNLAPVGKFFIQLCRTTPCWLRGSDELRKAAEKKLGIGLGETTNDGLFTMIEVECLGACVNAPMVQINDDYYEDLTADNFETLLDQLAKDDGSAKTGSQIGRQGSAPEGGPQVLTGESA